MSCPPPPGADEEGRLTEELEAYSRQKASAEKELANPTRSILYPDYEKLVDTLRTISEKCDGIRLRLREIRKAKRDSL